MSNPAICPLEERVELISNYLAKQTRKVVFCHTINCDPHVLPDRLERVYQLGGNGVHINVLAVWEFTTASEKGFSDISSSAK